MRSLIVILVVFTLTGCGIFRPLVRGYSVARTGGTKSLVMDAKRRAIIGIPNPNPENIKRMAFLCAEPSPDALAAISTALTLSPKADKDTLTIAVTEAARQLGRRNATIQLLRDGLYRQCEAFLNGIVDAATYSWMANKYVNAMVVLLAIEEITPDPRLRQDKTKVSANGKKKQEGDSSEDSGAKPTTAGSLLKQPQVEVAATHRNGEVSEAIAKAVTGMTTEFLKSDWVSYCLHMLRFDKNDPFYGNMCKLIVGQPAMGVETPEAEPPALNEQELQKLKDN